MRVILAVLNSAMRLTASNRRIVISTGASQFFTGSGMEKSIETDLASLSTAWFSTTLHSARNDDSEGAVTNSDFYEIINPQDDNEVR